MVTEPIITFNNRTLRVEGEGWSIDARVLASGRQLMIRCRGNVLGANTLLVLPSDTGEIFVSSHASQQEAETHVEPERPDSTLPPAKGRTSGAKR